MKQFIDKVLPEQFFDQLPVWNNIRGLILGGLVESITSFFPFFIDLIGMSFILLVIIYFMVKGILGFLDFQKT